MPLYISIMKNGAGMLLTIDYRYYNEFKQKKIKLHFYFATTYANR